MRILDWRRSRDRPLFEAMKGPGHWRTYAPFSLNESTVILLLYLIALYSQTTEQLCDLHYDDVIMTMLACQITSLTVVYSIVYSGVNQRKHQSSASLAFVREIHRGPVNVPHKWPVTRKMFPFDDVIMYDAFFVALRMWYPFNHNNLTISQSFECPRPTRPTPGATDQL